MSNPERKSVEEKKVDASNIETIGVSERQIFGFDVVYEIIQYQGKQYKAHGAAIGDSFAEYDHLFDRLDEQGWNWIVVPNFTSARYHDPTPVVFIEMEAEVDKAKQPAATSAEEIMNISEIRDVKVSELNDALAKGEAVITTDVEPANPLDSEEQGAA